MAAGVRWPPGIRCLFESALASPLPLLPLLPRPVPTAATGCANPVVTLLSTAPPCSASPWPDRQFEHKVYVKPFSDRFPQARVYSCPGQWSWPVNLPPSFRVDGVLCEGRSERYRDVCNACHVISLRKASDCFSITPYSSSRGGGGGSRRFADDTSTVPLERPSCSRVGRGPQALSGAVSNDSLRVSSSDEGRPRLPLSVFLLVFTLSCSKCV